MCKNWKVELRGPAAFKPEPRVGGSWCFSSQLEVRALRVGSGRAGAEPKWSCQGDGTFWPPSKWVQGMTRDPVTTTRISYLLGYLSTWILYLLGYLHRCLVFWAQEKSWRPTQFFIILNCWLSPRQSEAWTTNHSIHNSRENWPFMPSTFDREFHGKFCLLPIILHPAEAAEFW